MSGTITPMTSWKIDVSHWPVVTEMPKSDTMVGSAALNCSCVKLPTNVIKVRMAIDTNAACVRWSFLYDSSPVSGWDRPWVRPCFAFIFFSGFTSDLFSGFDGNRPPSITHPRILAAYCATPAKTDSKSLVLRVVEREMKLFEHVQFQFNREKLAKLRICSSWGGIHMRWQ